MVNPSGKHRRQILHAVHGQMNLAPQELLFNFFREKPFAATRLRRGFRLRSRYCGQVGDKLLN